MIWKLTDNRDWTSLEKEFSWVADMKNVPQSKIYHSEGNVDVHTQMVLEELKNLVTYQSLNLQDQEILWTAALMHDIEKRSTSVDEGDGHISSKGHAKRGEFSVRSILFKDIPTPFDLREQIASLVRFHGLPVWILEKEYPEKKLAEVSLRLNTMQLTTLAEADMRGRKALDIASMLDRIELFQHFCEEMDCYGKPRSFASPNARYTYFNTDDSYIDYVPFDNFKSKVIMLSGLPGMGKDHYIQSLNRDLPVVSLDAIRRKHKIAPTDAKRNGWVVQEAKEQARVYLRAGQDFIWNATNITKQMRTQLIDLFVSYQAYVTIAYIEKPYKDWRLQNRNREYQVPEKVLDKMLLKLEIPRLTEAHEVHYVVI